MSDTSAPAACHALSVRVPAGTPIDLPPWVRLWVEPTTPADAERRRAAELARPVPADQGLRAVLLRDSDSNGNGNGSGNGGDLVLVAHRAALPPEDLHAFAAALLAGGSPEFPPPVAVSIPDFAMPAWGAGESTGTVRLAVPAGGDTASWTAAMAVALARYDSDPTAFAVLAERVAVHGSGPVVAALVLDPGPPWPGEYVPCLRAPAPVTVTVEPESLRCDYRQLDPVVATAFLRHLARAHVELQADPGRSPDDVDLLDAAERAAILDLGRTPAPSARPRRVTDAFADQVARRPDAVALTCDRTSVTYRELDQWSDRLAHGLRAAGSVDGDRVGVCLDRSTDLVAVLLGVLKAGGVYVPMDPTSPAERLGYTAVDAGLRLVVTTASGFPGEGLTLLTPDEVRDLGATAPAGPPASAVRPDDPAYVIYTSGSTGRPKGCVVPHRNVTALLDATADDFALGPADVWTVFHSSAFDFSVWEIWGCLLTGGRLVVVPYWVARTPDEFRELLRAEQVTVLSQTPSAFTMLLAAELGRPADLAVRLAVFGGEPLRPRGLLPWLDRYRDCRVVNMFGITETTVHVTARTITRELALRDSREVGRALPGWSVRVLDAAGRVAPIGVAGEIHVGGVGVAAHYLARPELTAQRFLPDPDGPGRLYRSGDRGRLLPDGSLEHLGRLDNQVKVRGFRVELDEIACVLREAVGVADAVVVPRAVGADVRLDAYVIGSTAGLGEHAARLLPDHMVPATYTAVDAFPLTVNGKLDSSALPDPTPRGSAPTAAATDLGGVLAEVWHTVLGIPVAPDDDFFALGGTSLSAVRISAELRARGMAPVPPRTLYLNPTVRRLAEALSAR